MLALASVKWKGAKMLPWTTRSEMRAVVTMLPRREVTRIQSPGPTPSDAASSGWIST